ncbi:MAG: hypothetical protein AABX39_04615, partial [Nanoarchaeota archaeon]
NTGVAGQEFGENYRSVLAMNKNGVVKLGHASKNSGILTLSGKSGGEGGQLILGAPGEDAFGESSTTWSIDSDVSGNFRIFYGTSNPNTPYISLTKDGNFYIVNALEPGGASTGKFLCIDSFNKVYKRDVPCNT